MKFSADQIALCPKDPIAAKKLLSEIGAASFVEDHVVATGFVFGQPGTNEANLSFNYDLFVTDKPIELEVLNYTTKPNWMDDASRGVGSVSHIATHCSEAELAQWREFFSARGIAVAQEVITDSHTNENIAGIRRYNYVIFDTKEILSVDLKFIVRLEDHPQVDRRPQ